MASTNVSDICAGDHVMVTDGSLKHLKDKRGWVSRLVPGVNRGIEVELPGMPCSVGFAADQLQRVAPPRSGAGPRTPDQQTLF
ncbi:MAG: hypothetical protein L0G70_10965 [Rubrobacter sp.]|nr:hypothetical protein [Rubrobacter sp.]